MVRTAAWLAGLLLSELVLRMTGVIASSAGTGAAVPVGPVDGSTTDAAYMRRAVDLARRALGRTAPNPSVGCVLVRDDEVVGEGWHARAGVSVVVLLLES